MPVPAPAPARPHRSEALADDRLVARCRAGDDRAWDELVGRYSAYVHAIARRGYGLSAHDAEDLTQEVFARTCEKLATLRDDGALRPFLGQVTRRLAIDRLRASARVQLSAEPVDSAACEEDHFARVDEALAISAALAGLSAPGQELIDRFFTRDESYQTIGAALAIPEGTIASRISRCLAKLRLELEA